MLLTAPAPKTLAPVLSGFEQKLSLKQLDDGAYLIGGGWPARITDFAGNRYEMLDDSVKASLEVARLIYPPVGSVELARSWAGLEAFTLDGLPVIGPVPDVRGLLVAAGFSGHGFALSPAVGEVLARLALRRDALDTLWSGLRCDRGGLEP
jgi:sarcosine oxidase subunit beta